MGGWGCGEVLPWGLGNRGKRHLFQGSTETKAKILGKQGNKAITGEQGTQEIRSLRYYFHVFQYKMWYLVVSK